MWLLGRHVRAFLVTATLVAVFFNLKNQESPRRLQDVAREKHFRMTNETIADFDEFGERVGNGMRKRKKYREFILKRWEGGFVGNESNLYVLGLFEENEGVDYAARMAVDDVNEKKLLGKYKLKLLVNNTQCDPGAGIDRFFHALYSKKRIIALIASGCSNVTESLANIVPYWNIVQLSYGSTSAVLSDRNKFPLFFRTVASDFSMNDARLAFVKNFKWNTVAIFSQHDNDHLLPMNTLAVLLEANDISCAVSFTFAKENLAEQLQHLKESDVRVIFGSFSKEMSPMVFCEVYKLGMFGADYVWILSTHDIAWWKSSNCCPNQHLQEAVEGTVHISPHYGIPDGTLSSMNLTNEDFYENSTACFHCPHVYDAVWALALALQKVQHKHPLSDFYYDNDDFIEEVLRQIQRLKFTGISGPVGFKGADRTTNSLIRQMQGGALVTVALHIYTGNRIDLNCNECLGVKWRGNRVPIAKRILRIKLVVVPLGAKVIVLVIGVVGVVVCLVFLYFNYHFRDRKAVKLSSPKLNSIATVGCGLVYVAVVLLGIDTDGILSKDEFSKICTVRVYLFSAGFSLAFGSIFAKTYRVHRIFICRCASLVKDKILKDQQLITLVLTLLIVDGIIVSLWEYMDPLHRDVQNLTPEFSDEDVSILYQYQVEICSCNNTAGWFLVICGYKAFLLVMGVYMAWETRHIKIEMLNDSQYIGVCVYSAVFASIVVLLSNFLAEYVLLAYLARASSILLTVTLTLMLLFLPKLKAVVSDQGEDAIVNSLGLKIESNTRRLLAEDPNELTYRLEVQNKVFRCEIEALDKEIERLEKLLLKEDYAYKGPRASWPTTQLFKTDVEKSTFLSDCSLHEETETFDGRVKLLSRLKKLFGRIPSVWLHFSTESSQQQQQSTIYSVQDEMGKSKTQER